MLALRCCGAAVLRCCGAAVLREADRPRPRAVAFWTQAALFAGFSIPMKLQKFKLDIPGREIIEVSQFTLIAKKSSSKVFLLLCTDVALMCQMIDDDCYELMFMPVQRSKIKAKVVKAGSLGEGVVGMKVTMGKTVVLKCKDEMERSLWIGKLNAPIGFVPTKSLG